MAACLHNLTGQGRPEVQFVFWMVCDNSLVLESYFEAP